jgi:hypothetical protein
MTPEDQAKVDRIFFLRVSSSDFAGLIGCTDNTQDTKECVKFVCRLFEVPITNGFQDSPRNNQ